MFAAVAYNAVPTSLKSTQAPTFPRSSTREASNDENSSNTNYFSTFQNRVGFEPEQKDAENASRCSKILRKMRSEFKESILHNQARENASELFHALEKGKEITEGKNSKNGLYKSFFDIKHVNNVISSPLNEQNVQRSSENAENPDNPANRILIELKQHFSAYESYLNKTERKNNLKEETSRFFMNLLSIIPEGEKREEGKNYLKKLSEAGSNFINKINTKDQTHNVNAYFEACENFINLIFEGTGNEFAYVKSLALSGISCAGLILSYKKRSFQQKFCIWLKRLFVPIGFALHELAGVGVAKFESALVGIAVKVAVFATIASLAITFGIGFAVVVILDKLIDNALEVAEEQQEKELIHHVIEIKYLLKIAETEGPLNKIDNSYIILWLEKTVEKMLSSFVSVYTKVKDFFVKQNVWEENFDEVSRFLSEKLNKEKLKDMSSDKNEKNNSIGKEFKWFLNDKFGLAVYHKTQLNTFFDTLDETSKPLVSELFHLQNRNMNKPLDDDEKEALEKNLEDLYSKIAETNIEKLNPNESEKIMLNKYFKLRIENYSKILCDNKRKTSHKLLHYSYYPTFFGLDFATDTFGNFITHVIENANVENVVIKACAAALAGAFILLGVGIVINLAMKAWSASCDKKGIEVPNENIYESVKEYLTNQQAELNKELELEQNKNHFSTAKQARLNAEIKEIIELLARMKKANEIRAVKRENSKIISLKLARVPVPA